jgi:hypothetical protein
VRRKKSTNTALSPIIEMERCPQRACRTRYGALHISAKKGEPGLDCLEWRLGAPPPLPPLAGVVDPMPIGRGLHYPQDRPIRTPINYAAPQEHAPDAVRWTRSIPSCSRPTTSSASRCTSRWRWPAWRWTRCSTPSRSRPPSRQAQRGGRDLLPISRPSATIPIW